MLVNSTNNCVQLPEEMWLGVMKFISDPKDIGRLSRVAKLFLKLSEDSSLKIWENQLPISTQFKWDIINFKIEYTRYAKISKQLCKQNERHLTYSLTTIKTLLKKMGMILKYDSLIVQIESLVQFIESTADKTNSEAMFVLGKYYFERYKNLSAVDKEPFFTKGREYLQKAKDIGHVKAMYTLGCHAPYCDSFWGSRIPNVEEAFTLFKLADKQGEPNAPFRLALCYFWGEGTEKNLQEAERYATLAAEYFCEDSDIFQHFISLVDDWSFDTDEHDLEPFNANQIFMQCMHLHQGYLGLCYLYGVGTHWSLELGVSYVKQCDSEDFRKEYHLDKFFRLFFEDNYNVKEKIKAYQLLIQDQDRAYTYFALGCCNLKGIGTPQNYQEAFKYFQRAGSDYWLGLCYQCGYGVEINLEKAFDHYQKSKRGKREDLRKLATDLFAKGVDKSDKIAFECTKWVVRLDYPHPEDIFALGVCYAKGQGTAINLKKALEYLKEADDKGHKGAREMIMTLQSMQDHDIDLPLAKRHREN